LAEIANYKSFSEAKIDDAADFRLKVGFGGAPKPTGEVQAGLALRVLPRERS